MLGMKIYVDLPDELVAVWCPVGAVHVEGNVYQIIEENSDPEDTRWAFTTGAKLRCRPRLTSDGQQTMLVAYEEVLD